MSRTVVVRVSKELHDRLAQYSRVTGVPMARAATEAMAMWLKDVAPEKLEVLDGQAQLS